MFFIVLFFVILYREFSVIFQRSKNVVALYGICGETRIHGKIVIEGPSKRFEEDFNLTYYWDSFLNTIHHLRDVKVFPADLEENSIASVQLFQDNKPTEGFYFVWRSQNYEFYRNYECLAIRIIECSSNFPVNQLVGRINCQSHQYILAENLSPVGHLGFKFNPNSDPDLMVKIDSIWETETLKKRDYYIDRECIGLTNVWDEKHLRIQFGNENWSQLNIKNSREVQIFQFRKFMLIYIPYNRYVQSVYHYILYIKNIDNRKENYVLADEIVISVYDKKKLPEPRVALNRKLLRLYPGFGERFEGQIEGIPEAKSVMVQIKTYEYGLTRDILVIPVIYNCIKDLNRQIVISGSKKNFVAILVLSTKPITSLTELYLVTIKTSPNVYRFQFCIKDIKKPCKFKDTAIFNLYQHVSASLNPIEQLVLKSGNTEHIMSTDFETEETTESIDMLGVHVEVDIRRMPKDGKYFKIFLFFNVENNSKWSSNDDNILSKWCSTPTYEKSMVKKDLSGKATNL